MAPDMVCEKCGGRLDLTDRFCPACGHAVAAAPAVCKLCGHENRPGDAVCASCGADLPGSRPKTAPDHAPKPRKAHVPPLRALQSWKLTAGLAVALVAALIILWATRSDDLPKGLTPQSTAMVKQIEELKKVVDADPSNMTATLQLANLYYDVQMFPGAVQMYDRYLESDPANADARVDMGVSYFQMALADSAHSHEYFGNALDEIKKAIGHNPKHQLAHFNLGMISLHMGDLQGANEWFRKCAAIDSTTETGKRALQLVHQHSVPNPS